MVELPIQPRFKRYRGAKPNLQRKAAEEYSAAKKIADHVNTLIANDPSEIQQYIFARIALDLRVEADEVRRALPGGYNGLTLRVTEADRRALVSYVRKT